MGPRVGELIFVTGPQAGQRASLLSNVMVVGRGTQADVQLAERQASRRQFQLTLTQDGWVFENLSTGRTRVNEKRYKTGKRIILDTGDVIGTGAETEILFVSAGDDPEKALAAWRTKHPLPAAAAEPDEAPAGEAEQTDRIAPEQIPEPRELEDEADESEELEEKRKLTEEERAAQERKAKLKKYGVIFGIYLALVIFGVIIVSQFVGGGETEGPTGGHPRPLTKDQISDFIKEDFSRLRNTIKAKEELAEANLRWRDRDARIGNLYRAVYHYKLAMAYSRRALPAEDERKFRKATKELIKRVSDKYDAAWKYEMDEKYHDAEILFTELLNIIPCDPDMRQYEDPILKKVVEHLAFIKRQLNLRRNR